MTNSNMCPVCSSGETKLFLKSKDHFFSQEGFDIWACKSCELKYTNPRPGDDKLSGYYKSEEYISHSDTSKGLVAKLYKWVRGYTLGTKEAMLRKNVSRGTLLDYGCGTGYFLSHCKGKSWTVFGIEPDEGARRIAQSSLKQIYDSKESLGQAKPQQKFNAITLWHVLEHIPNLKEVLDFLNRHLEDDGVLIIAVPNPDSYDANKYKEYWAAYDLPRHLWHFNERALGSLLSIQGFRLRGVKPMRFDSYYVSLLSEKYKRGKPSFLRALITGFISNLKAGVSKNYSSKIYIFEKSRA